MRNKALAAIALAIAGLTAACNNDDNHWNYRGPELRLRKNIGLDMAAVQGFTLAPVKAAAPHSAPAYRKMSGDCISAGAGGQAAAGADCINLFALSATGIVPVEIFEVQERQEQGPGDGPSNNNPDQWMQIPQTIYNVGNFVLFVFGGQIQTTAGPCGMVILQKSDGALFCSQDAVAACAGPNMGCFGMTADQMVKATGDPNVVYAYRNDMALVRFDFSNPASATSTVLIDQSDGMAFRFEVNDAGDALVTFGLSNSQMADVRYYKRDSGFSPLPMLTSGISNGGGQVMTFAGPGTSAGDFFAITPPYDGNSNGQQLSPAVSNRVLRITLDAAEQATHSTYAYDANGWGMQYQTGPRMQGSTADRHFVFFQTGTVMSLFEAYNPAGTPAVHTLTGFTAVNRLFTCDTHVVLSGKNASGVDVIARFDPVTAGTEVVLDSLDYTVSQVDVAKGCDITFGGRRAADNSRVIGNIPANTKDVTVVTNALDGDVKQLLRIR